MRPLKSRMPYKDVTNSVSKFGGILFTPTGYNMVFSKAVAPLKVRVSLHTQNGPPPPPKPLQKPWCICHHVATAYLFQLTHMFLDTACFVYPLHWSPPWVEISTLTYETNTNCWPKRFSVVYCTHILQTKLMLKNWKYPQTSILYNYKIAHRHASCSAGVLCRDCEAVTCNTQPSVY